MSIEYVCDNCRRLGHPRIVGLRRERPVGWLRLEREGKRYDVCCEVCAMDLEAHLEADNDDG